jgi:hypothetical protein
MLRQVTNKAKHTSDIPRIVKPLFGVAEHSISKTLWQKGFQLLPHAYLHNFGTQLHQLRHPLRGGGKNGIDGQVKFIMRSVDRSRKHLNDN